MDPTQDNLDDQMEELREALRDLKDYKTVDNTGAISGSYGYDTVTLNGGSYNNNTVVGGGYTVSTGLGINYPNTASITAGPYTYSNGTSGINWGANITTDPWATTTTAGKLKLEGDNADIEINGVSLLDLLRDRLNIMIPNPELEKEWDQLRELGDQYRKLEKDLKEKAEIWARLNDKS